MSEKDIHDIAIENLQNDLKIIEQRIKKLSRQKWASTELIQYRAWRKDILGEIRLGEIREIQRLKTGKVKYGKEN